MLKLKFNKYRPEQSLGFLLWQATHAWQRQISDVLRPLGLTHMQFVLMSGLSWLAGRDKTVTQIMLASHANVDVMMASNVIRTLARKNLVERKKHPSDARAQQLLLSEQGVALLKRAIDQVEQNDTVFFEGVQAEQADLHKALLTLLVGK